MIVPLLSTRLARDGSSHVAQLAAQDLADGRLRQRVDEAHDLRHLVAGEFLAADTRSRRPRSSVAPAALTTNSLTASPDLLVGHADAGAFGHAGAGGGHFLDLVREDVEARDDDHVLLAVDDLQEALVVEHADVAGAEVAVGGERAGVGLGLVASSRSSPAGPWRRSRRIRRCRPRWPSSSSSLMSVDGSGSPVVPVKSLHRGRVEAQHRAGLRQAVAFADEGAGHAPATCPTRRAITAAPPPPARLQVGPVDLLAASGAPPARHRACSRP